MEVPLPHIQIDGANLRRSRRAPPRRESRLLDMASFVLACAIVAVFTFGM